MVLLIIIPIKWLFVWEYTLFSDKPKSKLVKNPFALPHDAMVHLCSMDLSGLLANL